MKAVTINVGAANLAELNKIKPLNCVNMSGFTRCPYCSYKAHFDMKLVFNNSKRRCRKCNKTFRIEFNYTIAQHPLI